MENVTLLRKSRTDDSAIIFNPLTDFYSIVSEQGNITEESDELSSLLASGSWRRPLKEEISDFSFDPSKEPKLQIPSINTGDIIKALELGKASRSTAFNIKDDLEKLAKWAEDVSEEDDDNEFEIEDDGWQYYAVSNQENSSLINELWASDPEGDLLHFENSTFVPSEETLETFDRPSVIPVDEDTAQQVANFLINPEHDEYIDIFYLNPEEAALVENAMNEMDFTLLDDETDVLLSSGELWYDNVDKHIRQRGQERDWHGRYNGAQHKATKNLFFPKARIKDLKLNLDPLKSISQAAASNNAEDATMYVAIVDKVDTSAVLDLLAITVDPDTKRPNSWIRRGGQWVQDDQYIKQIESVTPPTTILLNAEENKEDIESLIKQVDDTEYKRQSNGASIISPVLAAKAEDLSQEEKESIIASAISLHMTEVIPQNWYRENLNDLYTEYGEVLTAGGIPGIADTPQDFANTARLKNYWAFGKGTAKWLPGTPGDLTRLHNHLAKYVGPGRAWGLAQNIHKMHFGTTNYKRDH